MTKKSEREIPFNYRGDPSWIHLQWFGDVAETEGDYTSGFHTVVGEEEYEILKPDQPDPEAADSGEPEEFRGKSREELLTMIAAEKARASELAPKADTSAAILAGLKELAKGQAAPQPAAPVDTWKDLTEEEVNQSFIDNPYKYTTKLMQDQLRKLTPDLQRVLLNNKEYSRRFARMEDDLRFVFDNYSNEVEQVVNGFDVKEQISNVDVYKKAAELVRARHFIEIRDAAVAAELAKIDKEMKAQAPQRSSSFNEGGSGRTPTKQKIVVRASPEDIARAEAKGMEIEDYMRAMYPSGRK